MMIMSRVSELIKNAVCWVFCAVSFFSSAHAILVEIDFGKGDLLTDGWNNVTVIGQVYDLYDSEGVSAGWRLVAEGTNSSLNGLKPGSFQDVPDPVFDYIKNARIPQTAYQDSFFTHGTVVREIKISNMSQGATYDLQFFYTSSRMTENIVSNYNVGLEDVQVDASGFYSRSTHPGFDGLRPGTISNVSPNEDGEIVITYSRFVDQSGAVGNFGGISTLRIAQNPSALISSHSKNSSE